MGDRQLFTDDEWETLLFLPLNLFDAMAGAEGEPDAKARQAFARLVDNPTLFKEPFACEVMTALHADFAGITATFFESPKHGPEALQAAAAIVDARLPEQDARNFKESMLAVAENVALSSGGGLFNRNKISGVERDLLTAMGQILGVL